MSFKSPDPHERLFEHCCNEHLIIEQSMQLCALLWRDVLAEDARLLSVMV